MKRTAKSDTTDKVVLASTPEALDTQMIAMAYQCAAQQLADGTASAQVITHFLKMGTEKERLEREKLEQEVLLTKAKTENLETSKILMEMYSEAMAAFRGYRGEDDEESDEDVEDFY